jgi:two-component system phosphate regulon sensor histidine kinase PhoR
VTTGLRGKSLRPASFGHDHFLLLLLVGVSGLAWWLRGKWHSSEAERERERRAERERAAAFSHEQATRLDAILDGMIEGLVVLDAEGRIARVNRAAGADVLFPRMMVGGTLLEAIRHHEIAALAARAVRAERAIEHEVRIELSTGTHRANQRGRAP